eukprot:3837618-Prymnesium_polylepis.1
MREELTFAKAAARRPTIFDNRPSLDGELGVLEEGEEGEDGEGEGEGESGSQDAASEAPRASRRRGGQSMGELQAPRDELQALREQYVTEVSALEEAVREARGELERVRTELEDKLSELDALQGVRDALCVWSHQAKPHAPCHERAYTRVH